MKTYIQPTIVIENLSASYSVCVNISASNRSIQGFGIGDGGAPR